MKFGRTGGGRVGQKSQCYAESILLTHAWHEAKTPHPTGSTSPPCVHKLAVMRVHRKNTVENVKAGFTWGEHVVLF